MKFKSFTVLLALIPLIAFAAATQAQLPAAANASATSLQSAPSQSYAEYRNDQWHFSILVPSNFTTESYKQPGGVTIQFSDPAGNVLFQVSAWPYQDLDIALGEEGTPTSNSGQGDTLGIVHVFRSDLVELSFAKDGIAYTVQTLPENATSTLDILKSWEFI